MNAADRIQTAQVQAAVTTVNVTPINYQVFTAMVGLTILGSLGILIAILITMQLQNQTMDGTLFITLVWVDVVFVVLFLVAYLFYLRNIGKYVFSRIKPAILRSKSF